MKILSAMDLKNGAKAEQTRMFTVSQPLQFLPKSEKDAEWAAWNMDWLEWQGLKQIRLNARRLMKNYKLAAGQIDKTDYIPEHNNDMKDLVDQLADDGLESMELKFYPIIPNIINTLCSEFAKRDTRISFRAVDEFTHNDILERKRSDIENVLVKYAEDRLLRELVAQGLDPNTEEVQKLMQDKLNPTNLKTLPEIQDFYNKDYEVLGEKWASKQHSIDESRFFMDELEEMAFRDKLITDREFWHFLMLEDDYKVELWNPVTVFYHKSPKERYISNAQFVGNVEVMTASDVIDNYGWKMTEEQLHSLQDRFMIKSPGYNLGGLQNDGSYYDATQSHAWNVNRPSLEYRQMVNGMEFNGNDIISWILNESEDNLYYPNTNMLRVTTVYWKSQLKVGHLTRVHDNGHVETAIVTEDYKITDKPIYNTTLLKNKTNKNLIFGEHIEWVWINQSWGGIKIGPNAPTMYGMHNVLGISPIYLGINQNEIKPLRFQFKGETTIYGCKLPVEGRVFSDRNTKSSTIVDKLKPAQIGFNIVNNQIADILVDEIGTVVLLDQNALPKHSMGEDWGKNNLAKAYVAMKDFSMLPLDTSVQNTGNALAFSHFQQLDLSQTQRLLSRIQLATFFKEQAFELIGVSPQRMGQAVGQTVTATEVEQLQVGSYSQTEVHFIEHCDQLMPRVHQMRTDLAQYYNATKPSIQLQMVTSLDERVNFELNGTELLLKDFHVYASTKANHRKILEQMKSMAINNNTTGASIYDLGKIMQTDTLGSLNTTLKNIEEKIIEQRQEQMQHEQQLQDNQLKQAEKEKAMELEADMIKTEKMIRKDILVAEIRASGFGAMQDIDQNQQSDFIDNMNTLKQTEQYQESINIQREKVAINQQQHADKLLIEREKMATQRELKEKDLEIARENKNQFDIGKLPKPENKEKKKK